MPARHFRSRRCLLKGCEQWFRPIRPQSRYCSDACRRQARRWRCRQAGRAWRASEHGKARRREQCRRSRRRIPLIILPESFFAAPPPLIRPEHTGDAVTPRASGPGLAGQQAHGKARRRAQFPSVAAADPLDHTSRVVLRRAAAAHSARAHGRCCHPARSHPCGAGPAPSHNSPGFFGSAMSTAGLLRRVRGRVGVVAATLLFVRVSSSLTERAGPRRALSASSA